MLVCLHYAIFFFFFFKQKTAYEMRISDWSSDVCSSDLRREPTEDHDAPRVDDHRARPGQVAGERDAELAQPLPIAVPEQRVRARLHHLADGGGPRPDRKSVG